MDGGRGARRALAAGVVAARPPRGAGAAPGPTAQLRPGDRGRDRAAQPRRGRADGDASVPNPRSHRAASKIPGQPRLAAGLAGLGWGAVPHRDPAAEATGAARRAANWPMPTTRAARKCAVTAASASSHAANSGSRSHLRPTPEARAAHLATPDVEAAHRALRMLARGPADRRLDAEPIPDHRGIAERHAGLDHPERSRVHPDEQYLPRLGAIPLQVEPVRRRGVVEGRVDAVHRRREPQAPRALPEPLGNLHQPERGCCSTPRA